MSKICEKCGNTLEDSATFCADCKDEYKETVTPESDEKVCEETAESDGVYTAKEKQEEGTSPDAVVPENSKEEIKSEKVENSVKEPEIPKQKTAVEAPFYVNKEETKLSETKKIKKRVTVKGVIGAIVLSFLLIINLAVGAAVTVGMGFSLSDISEFSITVDGQEYSLDSIEELFDGIKESDFLTMLDDFFAQDNILIYMNGGEYELTFDTEMLSGFKDTLASSSDNIMSIVTDSIGAVLDVLFVIIAFMAIYVFAAICLNVYSIYSALGKTKKAHIVSGVILVIFSIVEIVYVVISLAIPGAVENALVYAVMNQMMVVLFAFVSSMFTAIAGALLFFIGIFGKDKD